MVAGLIFYNKLPEVMPIHFDISGNPDGYASRFFAVFGLPTSLLLVHLLVWFMLSQDPKRYNQYPVMITIVRYTIPTLSILINTFVYLKVWGYRIDISFLIMILVGVLFILIGNYMPKVKQNYTMGIRTPWTLNSERNWIKTHRFGGVMFVMMGFGMMILAFFKKSSVFLLMLIIVPVVLIYMYSYIIYRREKDGK